MATPASQDIFVHTDQSNAVPRRAWSDLSGVFAALLCRTEHANGGWKHTLAMPVSSSDIRTRLAEGKQPPELPPEVMAYIRAHGLYGFPGAGPGI